MKTTTALAAAGSVALTALMMAGCANEPPVSTTKVVRTAAPQHAEASITSYFDLTRKPDPTREIVVGAPQRGACPMGGYVGWVVPVEYKTRSKDSSVVTITSHFFWFSDEVIRGVTPRMEICP